MSSLGRRRVVRVRVICSGEESAPDDAVGAVMPGGAVVLEWLPGLGPTPGHVAVGPMAELIARAAELDWWVVLEPKDLTFEGLRGRCRLVIHRATDRHWRLERLGAAGAIAGTVGWAEVPQDDAPAYDHARRAFPWLLPRS